MSRLTQKNFLPRGILTPRHAKIGSARFDSSEDFNIKDAFLWFILPICVVVVLRFFVLGFYVIPSGSMLNTIHVGDRVITSQLTPQLAGVQRGDIIVFKDPANWLSSEKQYRGNDLIKRLIGLPGDVVACEGFGSPITINGTPIDESAYLREGDVPSMFAFNVTVTKGHVFVLGDNRSNSADSRYHQNDGEKGLVPVSDIRGVAVFRYWPLSRLGALQSHHEVFSKVAGAIHSVKR